VIEVCLLCIVFKIQIGRSIHLVASNCSLVVVEGNTEFVANKGNVVKFADENVIASGLVGSCNNVLSLQRAKKPN
jgi:hypothetical protein